MRILIVKRDKLGDMLLTTPLIAHLRSSIAGAQISVLASDYCGWVVRDFPDLARLWTYPRLRFLSLFKPSEVLRYRAVFREVRRLKFDVVIAAGGEYSPRAVSKAFEAGAARTVAYAPERHRFGPRLTDRLEPPRSGHEMDNMLALAGPLGVPPPSSPIFPEYRLPDAAREFAGRWLAARGLSPGRYIVQGLGARKAVRQPSPQQILRWSARWRDERGFQTVFTWTPGRSGSGLYPGDDDTAAEVLAAGRADIHPIRGHITEVLGVLWQAAASIFPDSGMMHFAAAGPGGVVGLIAGTPRKAEHWAPRGPRARWLRAPQAVSELADDEVLRELDALLKGGAAPATAEGR